MRPLLVAGLSLILGIGAVLSGRVAGGIQSLQAPSEWGVWIGPGEIAALPMRGSAWQSLAAIAADGAELAEPGAAEISHQDSDHDVETMGLALYAARTGDARARRHAIAALESAIGTEDGGRWLAVGRNLGGYIIAADVLGLRSGRVHAWLRSFTTKRLQANNERDRLVRFHQSAWESGSNAAVQEGFVYTALASYLGDRSMLEWSWNAFRRYAGDRTSPHRLVGNDHSWQTNPSDPVGIQNAGAVKDGIAIDGAISGDMSRAGELSEEPRWTQYPWVALEGAVPAAVVFQRAGYPAFSAADFALRRAALYLLSLRDQDEAWYDETRSKEIKHLLNVIYQLDLPVATPTEVGRTVGFTDWTFPGGP